MDIKELWAKIHSRQKYLFFRCILYIFVSFYVIKPFFEQKEPDSLYFLNTLFITIAPLCIEYIFGLDTFNKQTTTIRSFGIIVTMLYLALIIFIMMSGMHLQYSSDKTLESFSLFSFDAPIFILQCLVYVIPILTILDLVFTISKLEVITYKEIDDVLTGRREENTEYVEEDTRVKNTVQAMKAKYIEPKKEE